MLCEIIVGMVGMVLPHKQEGCCKWLLDQVKVLSPCENFAHLCLCLLPLWRDEDIQYLAFPLSPAETRLPKLESS